MFADKIINAVNKYCIYGYKCSISKHFNLPLIRRP